MTLYLGASLDLESKHLIRNFLLNLHYGNFLLNRYEKERHNHTNDYKFHPDVLPTTLTGFLVDGSFDVFARVSGQYPLHTRALTAPLHHNTGARGNNSSNAHANGTPTTPGSEQAARRRDF